MGIAAGVLIALGTTTLAHGYEVKSDTMIEAGAAARAAARIGYIRGTISYDEIPAIIQPENPQVDETDRDEAGIDFLPTGSIRIPDTTQSPKIEWDVFDKYGRPVKRY